MQWPPYLPNMNSYDYSLWVNVKYKRYAENPKKKEELIEAIKKVVDGITLNVLLRVPEK